MKKISDVLGARTPEEREMLLNMVETPQGPAKAHEKKLAIGQAGDN